MKKYLVVLLALILSPIVEAKEIKLTWDDHPDPAVTGFRLYYWTPNAQPVVKDCGMVKPCSIDVEIAQAYSIAATAYTAAGLESDFSSIVVYFEMYGTPLTLVSVGPNKVAQLSWLQAPPAKGYQLVYGDETGWKGTNYIAGATNNVAQVSLIQGTNLFRVRPVFQGQEGFPDYTSDYSATKEISPPARPVLRLVLPAEQVVQ